MLRKGNDTVTGARGKVRVARERKCRDFQSLAAVLDRLGCMADPLQLPIFGYKPIQSLTALRATSLSGLATRPLRLIVTLYMAASFMGRNTALP